MAVIRHNKQWYFWAKIIAKVLGIVLAFVPAFISAIIMFPKIVVKETSSTISGVFILASLFAIIPMISVFMKALKTPSTPLVITIFLVVIAAIFTAVYFAKESTRYGLMVVSLTAAISNIVATVLFKLSSVWDELFKHCGEVYVNER